jgi:quercetin dioxygenase-like cupin family protein
MSPVNAHDTIAEETKLVDTVAEALNASPHAGAPTAAGRERLVSALAKRPHQLARFSGDIAKLADIPVGEAEGLLAMLDDARAWESGLVPGVEALWVRGGPAARNAIRGFVRVAEGHVFPEHEHLGPEMVLVMQGVVEDSRGKACFPGDIVAAEAGTAHGFRARPGGVDVLIFSVVGTGIRIGEAVIPARD